MFLALYHYGKEGGEVLLRNKNYLLLRGSIMYTDFLVFPFCLWSFSISLKGEDCRLGILVLALIAIDVTPY